MQSVLAAPRNTRTVFGGNSVNISRVHIKTEPESKEREVPNKNKLILLLTTFCGISIRRKSSGAEEPMFAVYECWGDVAHKAMNLKVGDYINVTGHIKPNDWLSENRRYYGPIRIGIEDFDVISMTQSTSRK